MAERKENYENAPDWYSKDLRKEIRKQVETYHAEVKESLGALLAGVTLSVHNAGGNADGVALRVGTSDGEPMTLVNLEKSFVTITCLPIQETGESILMQISGKRNDFTQEII